MAQSSILGGSAAPRQPRGTTTDLLGPSDSSDTGSDIQGERPLATDADDGGMGAIPADLDSDTDAAGTGERAASDGSDVPDAPDISPDRVVRASDELDPLDDAERLDVDDLMVDDPDGREAAGEPDGGDAAPDRNRRH